MAAVMHANTAMIAAAHGGKLDPMSVVDFMPTDSMTWRKRTRLGSKGIKHPAAQTEILKRAFGFT